MCNHLSGFTPIVAISRIPAGAGTSFRAIQGCKAICPLCGQVRDLYEDGEVSVKVQGYQPSEGVADKAQVEHRI